MSDELILAEQAEQSHAVQRGTYREEVRERAFEVWWFRAGRNAAETARILRAECDETPTITDRAIRKWIETDNWAQLANERLEQFAPNTYAGIVTDLLFGAQAGANYVRRVNEGDPSTRDKNGRVDVARVTSAFGSLDRAGFAPRTAGEQLKAPANASNELAEFASAAEANRFWIKGKE